MRNEILKKISILIIISMIASLTSCNNQSSKKSIIISAKRDDSKKSTEIVEEAIIETTEKIEGTVDTDSYKLVYENEATTNNINETTTNNNTDTIIEKKIYVDFTAPYATYSIINDGYAVLYELNKNNNLEYKNKIIAINAGHGTIDGEKIKTFSHPDFTPKVTGGTNEAGSILSYAVSSGTTFKNGMTEADANLAVAYALKNKLLDAGYSVLMIRIDNNCRLDNIARTVIANTNADAHISIHFDSTNTDKGIFYIAPYNNKNYLNMEPLKSNKENIKKLGECIISAFRGMGEKIWNKGVLQGDLTQLSFSTNPSVDIELGDRKTVLTAEKTEILAEGIKKGIDDFYNIKQ